MSLPTVKRLRLARVYILRGKNRIAEACLSAPAGPALGAQLRDLVQRGAQLLASIDQAITAETAALEAPHAFVPPPTGLWCARCGGVEDRHEPPAPVMAPCEAARARAR